MDYVLGQGLRELPGPLLLTGHTGFKGAWLLKILSDFGAIIKGYALAPESEINLYSEINGDSLCESVISDLRNRVALKKAVLDFQPDYIFHLAAQPLVRLSYEIPSPNSFSFNSPYGSCPTCKGLGTINQINMEAVIPNWKASIKEGGLAPLGEEREAYAYKQVISLAKKHKISLDTPIEKIPTTKLNILLYGNEEGVRNQDANSAVAIQDSTYEGLINMVYRWFEETNSEPVKDWAEQFMQSPST